MQRRNRLRGVTALVAIVLAAVAVAACGGSSGGSSSNSSTSGGAGKGATANVAAAKVAIAPYLKKPTAFPVATPLAKRPAAGSTLSYLQCSAPTCAEVVPLVKSAAKALDMKFQVVPAGSSTTSEVSAMNTIIASKPAIMILAGMVITPFCSELKTLAGNGTKIGAFGVIDGAKCGVVSRINSEITFAKIGALLADWAIQRKGAQTNAVFYNTPELAFSEVEQSAFNARIKQLCPSCAVRDQTLSITTFGSTAPSVVVSDLQAHSSTNVAAFATMEGATGLPAALKVASINNVLTVGTGPDQSNLQDIKAGRLSAGLGQDIPTMIYMAIDGAARALAGQKLTPAEVTGTPPMQFLDPATITDPSVPWSAFPDALQRFTKIWEGK